MGLMGLALASATAQAAAPWTDRAPLPEARQEVAVAALDGRVYVIGGFRGDASVADTVEVYDSASDSWSTAAPYPTPVHHGAAVAHDGRVYVFGGWPDFFATPLASVFAYDPATDSWSARASMPTARGSPAAAVLEDKIYVAGGWPMARSNDFAAYDPAANSWSVLPPMPTARNHLGAAALGGSFYAVGGRESLGAGVGNVDANEAYDPVAMTWTARAALPTARGGIAAVAVDRFVLVLGGEGNAGDPDGVFDENEAYDTALDQWTTLAPMPTGRHGIGGAVLGVDVHVPGGGPVEGFGVSDAHEVYDASSELPFPAPVPALPVPVAALVAGALVCAALWSVRRSAARAQARAR